MRKMRRASVTFAHLERLKPQKEHTDGISFASMIDLKVRSENRPRCAL